MSLQEIVVLIHNGEYGRAISTLEWEVKNGTKSPLEKVECCRWLAECNLRLGDPKESGNWYLEAARLVLTTQVDQRSKGKMALPLSEKALESFKQDGDSADILVAAKLRQYLLGLMK